MEQKSPKKILKANTRIEFTFLKINFNNFKPSCFMDIFSFTFDKTNYEFTSVGDGGLISLKR